MDDEFLGFILFLVGLFFLSYFFVINLNNSREDRIKAYNTQLATYVKCMEKSTDKSICGTIPNIKNYIDF